MEPEGAQKAQERAEALLAAKRPAEAVRLLSAAVAADPEDANLRAALARALHTAGDLKAAQREAERASALAPDWFFPMCQQASVLLARGRYGEARKRAEAARRLAPDEPLVYEWFGRAALECNSPRQAREALARWLELAPEDPDAHLLEVRLEWSRREWRRAEAAARRALALEPNNAEALHLLGEVLTRQGRGREGAEALVHAGREAGTPELAAATARAVEVHDAPGNAVLLLGLLVPWLVLAALWVHAESLFLGGLPPWSVVPALLVNALAVWGGRALWRRRRAELPAASLVVAAEESRRWMRDLAHGGLSTIAWLTWFVLAVVGLVRGADLAARRPPPFGPWDVLLFAGLLCATIVRARGLYRSVRARLDR
jgi:predicted Zn-dependent protease